MGLHWYCLVFMVYTLNGVVWSEPSECILDEMVDGQAVNIAFSRDIENVKADIIGAMYVRSPNFQTLLEDCLRMCCETEECNVATVDVTITNSLDSNCFLVMCQPLDQCEWEYEDRLTTAKTNRKPPTTTPKFTTLTPTHTPTAMSTTTMQKVTTLGVKSTTNLVFNQTQTTVVPVAPATTNTSLMRNETAPAPLASSVGDMNVTSGMDENTPAANVTTEAVAENSTIHANYSSIPTAPAPASAPGPAPAPATDNSTETVSNATEAEESEDNMVSNETFLNETDTVNSTSAEAAQNHTDSTSSSPSTVSNATQNATAIANTSVSSNVTQSVGANVTAVSNVTQGVGAVTSVTVASNVTQGTGGVTNVTVASNATQEKGVKTNASETSNVTQAMGVTNASSLGLTPGNELSSNESLTSPKMTTVSSNVEKHTISTGIHPTEVKNNTSQESNSAIVTSMTNIKTFTPDTLSGNNDIDSTGGFDAVLGALETILNDTMSLSGESESLESLEEITPNPMVSQDPSLSQPIVQILQHLSNDTSADDAAMNGTVYHATVMKEMPQSTLIALICASTLGVIIFFVVAIVVGKKMYDGWQRRHYTKVDYLVNGMYN